MKKLVMVSLDQEKAFDRIEHDILEKHMSNIGFLKNFVSIIMDLYRGFNITIKFPREMSKKIPVNRGIQQGSPLSAIIFIFAMGYFLKAVNNNGSINSICLPRGKKVKYLA